MPDPWTLVSAPAVELLGWTLLHFVWQGALVAALLAGALWALRRHGPHVRYAASLAALTGLLALPVATGVLLHDPVGAERSGASPIVVPETTTGVVVASPALPKSTEGAAAAGWGARVSGWVRPVLPWGVLAWGLGVLLLAGRWAGGAWRVRRLRRTSDPAPGAWRDRLAALADRVGLGRPVALRRSARVDSPMVSGWWRPVILVPAGLLTGLPPRQVEALLLHELAHVRRHDVLVGHLQALVETLLFFHPATWWVSGRVRAAREACCDDLAVQGGAERTVVARALAALAERAVEGRAAAWAPAASGGSLLSRVRRLLSPEQVPSAHAQRLSLVAAVLLVVGVPLGLAACASQQSATEKGTAKRTESNVAGSRAPDSTHRSVPRTVMRDDSTGRTMTIHADGSMHTELKENGVFVFRLDGGEADTIDLRQEWKPSDLDSLWQQLRRSFDGQVLRMQLNPDSSKGEIQSSLHPDSLDRALRPSINPDRLARALQAGINPDSLARVIHARINPDSIEREALEIRLRADSLAHRHREHADSLRQRMEQMQDRMRREMPERLREQARRLREQAERLEERAREMEGPESPVGPPPDSGRG